MEKTEPNNEQKPKSFQDLINFVGPQNIKIQELKDCFLEGEQMSRKKVGRITFETSIENCSATMKDSCIGGDNIPVYGYVLWLPGNEVREFYKQIQKK